MRVAASSPAAAWVRPSAVRPATGAAAGPSDVPWTLEGTLTENEIVTQRQAIGLAQNDLLTQLSGTEFRIVRVYDSIPGIALEVGNDALAVLRKSNSVSNVLPDRPINPASPGEIEGTSTKTPLKDPPLNPEWFQPTFSSRQRTQAPSLC
jgi:hypothetical protein